MICCEGYFERGNCPKYLKPVCEMMQKVNECAFLDDKDNLDLFVDKLELLLEKSRIKNSTAHIDVCYSDTDRGADIALCQEGRPGCGGTDSLLPHPRHTGV
ncbi:MAG: hypothetical protein IJP75_10630 [Bacteroidaceae bacterium]|nr:hypothetical protein [Bacteroidaceae bacterium]